MDISIEKRTSWLERPVLNSRVINWEIVLFSAILILALVTRLYNLEPRVMSHDENSHVYYSWLLSQGRGYTHDPITHGPFQFHIIALSYFLFGDSDTTARIPAVLFSIASVALLWNYRRYLGRAGTLVAALLMVISPYMLFYGRYVRNEAFVVVWGLITLYSILRYLESGKNRYLVYLTAATVLHFVTKETAFIYTAQALIFLGFYLLYQVTRKSWSRPKDRTNFLVAIMAALLLFAAMGAVQVSMGQPAATASGDAALQPDAKLDLTLTPPAVALAVAGAAAVLTALFFLIRGYTWNRLKNERSFDLIITLFTPILPMLAPFPVKMIGVDPINYNDPRSLTITAVAVVILALAAAAIGLLWKPRTWLANVGLFYAIFTVLQTTVFTNGFGFFTGLVGSLGYWLDQQSVNRGSQPLYYYFGLQVPVYEFLPAIGSLLALVLALAGKRPRVERSSEAGSSEAGSSEAGVETPLVERSSEAGNWEAGVETPLVERSPEAGSSEAGNSEAGSSEAGVETTAAPLVLPLLGYWAVTSLLAYTFAGEKMPWLTVHIALPMILLSGWSIGALIEGVDWKALRDQKGWLALALMPAFLASAAMALVTLLGDPQPFLGKSLEELRVTSTFVTALLFAFGSGIFIIRLTRVWSGGQLARLLTLFTLAFLGVLTARTAFRAAYINYDSAEEYLVYAHSAPGVKLALQQIEEISRRTTDGLGLQVAYDNETTYPFWWYLRDYPNQHYYGENPTRSVGDMPVILVGDPNYAKIEAVVRDNYLQYDYKRLWWPDQDYFGLTWERIRNVIVHADWREAIFKIWLNRDYSEYARLTGKDMSPAAWEPAAEMRLYVRKDIAAQMWNYGAVPVVETETVDPYAGKELSLAPERTVGTAGANPGELQRPRDLAVAADGSLYVADTNNHRIQHLAADGSVIQVWGQFSGVDPNAAAVGTFNEPWGIAQGPDGSVYVADTWNHRIQKFTAEGEFLLTWGYFGQAEAPEALWGPRDVAVDSQGRVFVSDTGNKRVVVFDGEGKYLTQFGQAGLNPGEFDEPVGLAVDSQDRLYVADTWNQRIQVFATTADGSYEPATAWDVDAWYGQSLDNKPYLTVSPDGDVFVTDPEGFRVIQYNDSGEIVRTWGDFAEGFDGFSMPGGVAVAPDGGVWVSDAGLNRLFYFVLPEP